MTLQSHLQALGVDIAGSLEELDAPAALVDASGAVLWQNKAAIAFVGDQRGTRFNAIAPDYVQQSRAALRRKTMGVGVVGNGGVVVVDAKGERKRIETISLSLLKGAEVVAVLGIVKSVLTEEPAGMQQRLTPRQRETLTLLAAGLTTEQVAESLGVARETARNHIRTLLKTIGAHSRLEAWSERATPASSEPRAPRAEHAHGTSRLEKRDALGAEVVTAAWRASPSRCGTNWARDNLWQVTGARVSPPGPNGSFGGR